MKFIKNYETTWHDTDAHRLVRPSALLVYMQETSNRHVASVGMSLDELRDKKDLAFILSKIRVDIHRRPAAFENITVETWTVEPRGFSSVRCFRILSGDEVIAECDSTWALVDTAEKKLHKFDETGYVFENEEGLTLEAPSRTRAPAGIVFERVAERPILYSDLDYNMHMNNTKYPDMLCDYITLEDVDRISGITLSYIKEAAYGRTVSVYRAAGENCYYFRTVNENDEICLEAIITLK